MTDYLKPVKAWCLEVKGVFLPTYCEAELENSEGRVVPVIITSTEWLTRAEFEANFNHPHFSVPVWVTVIDRGVVLAVAHRSTVCGIYFDTDGRDIRPDLITHVLPIPKPEAPSAQESEE